MRWAKLVFLVSPLVIAMVVLRRKEIEREGNTLSCSACFLIFMFNIQLADAGFDLSVFE